MNIIDLFCGCGGLSYGFEKAGHKVLLGIDNDEMALKTFEKNHSNSKGIKKDITKINASDIEELIGDKTIDIIVGGPPCQGMSLSGPRKFDDPRNSLYLSFIRLVKEIQPKAFVVENVPGLVSLFGGQIKDSILEEFSKLGYIVNYKILNASTILALPQNDEGLFSLAKDKKFDFPEPNDDIVTCGMALS